jgi:hypothetical protein
VGTEVSVEEAQTAAKLIALNLLASLKGMWVRQSVSQAKPSQANQSSVRVVTFVSILIHTPTQHQQHY